jgi:hypothetical protein
MELLWWPVLGTGLLGLLVAGIWTYRAAWHDGEPRQSEVRRRLRRLERGSWHP